MVGALILSFVIVLDEVVWEVLSGCHIGDSEDFRYRGTAAWSFFDPPVSLAPLWT